MKYLILVLFLFNVTSLYADDYKEEFCCVTDYWVSQSHESRLIPGIKVYDEPLFACPSDLDEVIKMPEHGEFFTCGGRWYVIHGNSITVYEGVPKEVYENLRRSALWKLK